jgi:hypothetical protein
MAFVKDEDAAHLLKAADHRPVALATGGPGVATISAHA